MSNSLLTEWICFTRLEEEEIMKTNLKREAASNERAVRAKRGK